jgi:hypothetical protein
MTNPDLTIPTHHARLFLWEKDTGIADASDLGTALVDARVWTDACDVGFWIKGLHRKILFTLSEVIKAPDGDVASWRYIGYGSGNRHLSIVIHND